MSHSEISLPKNSSEITSQWLEQVLNISVIDDIEISDIVTVQPGISSIVKKIRVSYIENEEYVTKCFAGKWAVEDVEKSKVYDSFELYSREVFFYECLAKECMAALPGVYYARYDEETGAFFLLLEFLDFPNGDCVRGCGYEHAEILIEYAAMLHASFWEHKKFADEWISMDETKRATRMNEHIKGGVERGVEHILKNEILSDDQKQFAEGYFERFDEIYDLAHKDKPRTIVHMDYHLNNMLLDYSELYLVDWQWCGITNPLYDVFYTLVYNLNDCSEEEELKLLTLYHETLDLLGVQYPLDTIIADYEQLVLSMFGKSVELGDRTIESEMSNFEKRIVELNLAWYQRYMNRFKRTKLV